jgi:hypothetical protein
MVSFARALLLALLLTGCGPALPEAPPPAPVPMCEAEVLTIAEGPAPEAMCVAMAMDDEAARASRLYMAHRYVDAIDTAEMALRAPDLDPVWVSWLRFLIARASWQQDDRVRAEQILREMIASPYEPLRWSAARWLCRLPDSVPTSDSSASCPAILRFPRPAS